MQEEKHVVTRLLNQWQEGDADALDNLMPIVYQELRKLAHIHLSKDQSAETLSTTALVHEAYLNLVDDLNIQLNSRTHFFAIASRVMRRVLIWHARKKGAKKRGGNQQRILLDDAFAFTQNQFEEFISLDTALKRLEKMDERLCRIVEYRYFGGLSVKETAELLQISSATVKRDWFTAKTWLKRELSQDHPLGYE